MSSTRLWFYGQHPCHAILNNPKRIVYTCVVQKNTQIASTFEASRLPEKCTFQTESRQWFEHKFGHDAIHQGIAVYASPLSSPALEEVIAPSKEFVTLLLLDQVTDPHNIGAILRSAAAFAVDALVLTDRHAPQESAILAKSASGALEHTPIIRMVNLVQTIHLLKQAGFWVYGFAEKGSSDLSQTDFPPRTALIMGAEGKGLRRLTQEHCDALVCLETSQDFSTLNVSNATAIALHHRFIQNKREG